MDKANPTPTTPAATVADVHTKSYAKTLGALVILAFVAVISLRLYSGYSGEYETSKFLFTADVSDARESVNYWEKSKTLSFVLGKYFYSLGGIVDFYIKTAEQNGWAIADGRKVFNEGRHTLEFEKKGQSQRIIVNLKRLDGGKVSITIIHKLQ